MLVKEIGGYLEFEKSYGQEFFGGLALNTSRNCLQFLIRERNIKKIYIPYYLCLVIEDTCVNEGVEILYYHIDDYFKPILDNIVLNDNEYIYVVNYFGMLSNDYIKEIKDKYLNIILDNTHSFYSEVLDGIDTIYNCRKYFGVPDGAYLISNLDISNVTERFVEASSLSRITHLFGRFEKDAQSFYGDFSNAEDELDNRNIELMSKITHNMLSFIDYNKIYESRLSNYSVLAEELSNINILNLDMNGTYMYPLLINKGKELRNYLIENNIYIPKLWPNLDKFELNEFESNLFENLVPLPIDQRYSNSDMKYILNMINKFLELESEK